MIHVKWEYLPISGRGEKLWKRLTEEGLDGWEVCGMTYENSQLLHTVLMKRPIESVGIQRKSLEKEQK